MFLIPSIPDTGNFSSEGRAKPRVFLNALFILTLGSGNGRVGSFRIEKDSNAITNRGIKVGIGGGFCQEC